MWSATTISLIEAAYDEDLGATGDLTSALLSDPQTPVIARVVPRSAGIICGLALAPVICDVFARRLASSAAPVELAFTPAECDGRPIVDGHPCVSGQTVATLAGPRFAVLAVERTLLNFLGRLSGVATLTARYVAAARAAHPAVQILDTRKTIPGWRELDKYAVHAGGGINHRFGLHDAVLIKDNHLAGVPLSRLAFALFEMLNRLGAARSTCPAAPVSVGHSADEAPSPGRLPVLPASTAGPAGVAGVPSAPAPAFVEVEVDTLDQLGEVCKVVGVDVVLLDNFTPEQMRAAVRLRDSAGLRGKLALEASGGVHLGNIAEIAATGIDRIAIGALTHSAPALDIGLDFEG
jgi:nicotinate-nucleotide pyrophosphorylase (carboxylating)